MTPALLVPLSSLPAPAPSGMPIAWPSAGSVTTSIVGPTGLSRTFIHVPGWMVDLSPPPLDTNGHPTRIDALPVLVGMLARAMGHPEGQHALHAIQRRVSGVVVTFWMLFTTPVMSYVQDPRAYTETTFSVINVGATTSTNHGAAPRGGYGPGVPALATIDPTDPLAPRLALVALFAARVWETA